MSHSAPEMKSLVEKVQKLPTLAEVGLRILELASDPEVSVQELSHAIHQDPSLAARILKIANSPFYGMVRQVDSLQLALVVLGLNEVRNLALGLSLISVLKTMNTNKIYDRGQFWCHSTSCGMVARILGKKAGVRNEGTDFLAGLLHDMGKIVLDEYFSEEFALIYERTMSQDVSMFQAEREILGETHDVVAGWLVAKWCLPETLRDAIVHHHDLLSTKVSELKDARLVALSYLAEAFCEHYGIGWDGDSGCNKLKDKEIWRVLLASQNDLSSEHISEILQDTLQTFNQSRNYIFLI